MHRFGCSDKLSEVFINWQCRRPLHHYFSLSDESWSHFCSTSVSLCKVSLHCPHDSVTIISTFIVVIVVDSFAAWLSTVMNRWDTSEPVGHVRSSWTEISTTCWTSTSSSCVRQSRQLVICPQVKWLPDWSVFVSSIFSAFGASTLLVVCQEEHHARKNWVMRC